MGSSRRFLPVVIAVIVLSIPLLAILAISSPPAGLLVPKRVPQHLIVPAPTAIGGAPHPIPGPALISRPPGISVVGTHPLIALPIEFQGLSHAPAHDRAFFDQMLNNPSGGSVNAFYRENSYGQFGIQATVANWVRSSRSMAYYGEDSSSGVDDRTGPIYRLVAEAVALADPSVNFGQFDGDGDGVVDHLVIVHAGGAQERNPGNSDLIWSHRWAVLDGNPTIPGDQRLVADGVQIYGYIMISEDSPMGVVSHELGHDLGLPDLYDTDSSSLGVGIWDVMGTGSWNSVFPSPEGTSPAHFSAWAKATLGWFTPIEVTAALLSGQIRAIETTPTAYRLTIKETGNGDEYFLVENRQRIGFDVGLPASGILIWHVDDSIVNNDNDVHRLVDLEEADEASGENPEDPTDAWVSDPIGFGATTVPNSNGYGNVRTGWKVRNIGPSNTSMSADLSKEVDDDLSVVGVNGVFAVPAGGPTLVTANVRNEGTRDQVSVNVTARIFLNGMDAAAERTVPNARRVLGSLRTGEFANISWPFTPADVGRYIVSVRVDLSADEIPENNERLSHFTVHRFLFMDDIETGVGPWTMPGQSSGDQHRWQIVDDADAYGSSHSPTQAWRFGFFSTLLPNPLPPEFHHLQSGAITVPAGPLYLLYYQRYDLWGRSESPVIINPAETDHGYTEVSINGGPWQAVGHAQGRNLRWTVASVNLTGFVPGSGATLRIRFNVTSSIMPQSGGWWIDDVMLTPTNFSYAVAIVPIAPQRTIEPGDLATFAFKAVNVGDFDDTIRLSVALPQGWTAEMIVNGSAVVPVDQVRVPLIPDGETTLQLRIRSPAGVLRGTVAEIPVTVASMNDPAKQASFLAIVEINDPLGLFGLQRYLPLLIVVGVGLLIIIVVVDRVKARKFRGTVR